MYQPTQKLEMRRRLSQNPHQYWHFGRGGGIWTPIIRFFDAVGTARTAPLQPPVPPSPVPRPKVVPLPTSGGGTARTEPSDAAFVPYPGALPTLSIRARGVVRLVGPAVRWCAFGAREQCVLAQRRPRARGCARAPRAARFPGSSADP